MRTRIVNQIRKSPSNAYQLSIRLNVNYRTVEHHLQILSKNSLITSTGEGYGKVYFLSAELSKNIDIFDDVLRTVNQEGAE